MPLAHLVDTHKRQKFLVCGTAPSIDQYGLEFYKGWEGVTIGVNEILDKFTPDYYLNVHEKERVVTCKDGTEIGFSYHPFSMVMDVEKKGLLTLRATVATTALSLAYQLGASEIHLIGIDLNLDNGNHFKGCSSSMADTHFINTNELDVSIRALTEMVILIQGQGVKVFNLSNNSLLEIPDGE